MNTTTPEDMARIMDRLSWQANAAAHQIRAGNIRDAIKLSRATADLNTPDFTHITLGDFHIHVRPPGALPVIDVESTVEAFSPLPSPVEPPPYVAPSREPVPVVPATEPVVITPPA